MKFNLKHDHISSYKPVRILGKGQSTTVYLAWCMLRKTHVIVKIANEDLSQTLKKRWIAREAIFLGKTSHSYIVNMYEYITEPVDALIVEYYSVASLKNFVKSKNSSLSWYEVLNLYSKLLSAICYIHSLGYVYLDLSIDNILFDGCTLKLIDFGLIRKPGSYGRLGTRYTMSPEQAKGEYVGFSSDVWGLGSIIFYLVAGVYPYDFSSKDERYPQKNKKPKDISEHITAPDWFIDIVNSMLYLDPDKRPSAEELFKNLQKESVSDVAL